MRRDTPASDISSACPKGGSSSGDVTQVFLICSFKSITQLAGGMFSAETIKIAIVRPLAMNTSRFISKWPFARSAK